MLHTDNPTLLIFGTMAASLLQILDTTIANVALPHMQAELGATNDEISWVLTSYIVATAVAMPITGWLSDRLGSRRLFLASVAGFVLTSMLCGMAQNITQMVIFRALQGISGAFVSPLSQTAMIDTHKPSRQPQVMALWGVGIMIGPILGPLIGGWLTDNWNWRAVFFVNVPVGAVSLAILMAVLPSRPVSRRRFDLLGFTLVGAMLTATQLFLDRGNQIDWFESLEAWTYMFIAVSSTWMAVIHFTTAKDSLFDRHLFADTNFVMAFIFSLMVGVVMFANMALLPTLLQHLLGYGVIDTGMAMMPRGVGVLISMQISGMMVRRGLDGRILMAIGFAIGGYSLLMMSTWSLQVDYWSIALSGLVQGLGIGLVFIPLNATAFSTLEPRLRTDASSLLNLGRSIGSSVGISVVITMLSRNIQTAHETLGGHVTSSAFDLIDISTIDRFQMLGDMALRILDAEVNRQAAMIAYVDDFYLMMWMSFAAVALVPLMRRAQRRPVAPAPEDLPH